MAKLRSELSSNRSASFAELDRLPYIHAIALEANRLSFGLTGRNPRVCKETLIYTNKETKYLYLIPPGTPISTSTILAHTDETVFPDPWTFNPDRWLGDEGQRRRKSNLAFSRGPCACIGMHLAKAELLLVIRAMAGWEMELYETDEEM
jgi:cytochrome P450